MAALGDPSRSRSPRSPLATRFTAATLVLLLAPLTACGSDPAAPQPAAPAASQVATTPAPPAADSTRSTAAEQPTAEDVFEDISAKVGSTSLREHFDRATAFKYIQVVKKSNGMFGSEYTSIDGAVLVRVTRKLTPKAAKVYEAALS